MRFATPIALATALLAGLAPAAGALNWTIEVVDTGNVGQHSSIALDSAGRPCVSYTDAAANDLKLARWDGSTWVHEVVDAAGATGWYTSIAIDSTDRPHMSYWDLGQSALRYARWTGAVWQLETVDNSGYVGQTNAIVLDAGDRPIISYYDYTNGGLKVARWNGQAWIIEAVETIAPLLGSGLYTAIALTPAGEPVVSHADHSNHLLKVSSHETGSWITQAVDGGTPIGTSIALDPVTGDRYVSYSYQFGQGSHLKFAHRVGIDWQAEIVAPGGDRGWYSRLVRDSDGGLHIVSWDLGLHRVEYSTLNVIVGDGPATATWITETVDDLAASGFTDQWIGLALSEAGILHATYRVGTIELRHAWAPLATAGIPGPAGAPAPAPPLVLGPIRPNPASATAVIPLRLVEKQKVRLTVHDAAGRAVRVLADGELPAGEHRLTWDGLNAGGERAARGVYFLRLDSRAGRREARLVLLP